MPPPTDVHARELYSILDELSGGSEDDLGANAVSAVASTAASTVWSAVGTVGSATSGVANAVGSAASHAASMATSLGGAPISAVGQPARASELRHGWEGTFQIETAILPGLPSRLIQRLTHCQTAHANHQPPVPSDGRLAPCAPPLCHVAPALAPPQV